MRLIFFIFFCFFAQLLFAQNEATIKEINQLIGPGFYFDTSNNGFGDDYYVEQKGSEQNIILLIAWLKEADSTEPIGKIFLLERVNKTLRIIDSSARYIRDGMGPSLYISNDTIELDHDFHGGYYKLYYTFDKESKKYLLVNIERGKAIKDKKYNNVSIGTKTEYYDINRKELKTVIELDNDSRNKTKITTINKPLFKEFIPDLAHFIDPLAWSNGDNSSDVYNKIF